MSVFADTDNNGTQDTGESGIEGVTVEVYSAGVDGVFDTADDVLEGSNVTGANGNMTIDFGFVRSCPTPNCVEISVQQN